MKKIKKFRIKPRPSFVLKGLKALMGSAQTTPELEQAVDAEIGKALTLFATAALYETVDREKSPVWAVPLLASNETTGAEAVALTFYSATIGSGLEEELAGALSRGEALRSQILTALGDEAAEQAAAFVYRLVADEAKEESCELSSRTAAAGDVERETMALLEAHKIQIGRDAVGHLSPRFTKTGYALWWPVKKKK